MSDYTEKRKKAKLYASSLGPAVSVVQKVLGIFDEPLPGRVVVPDCHQYSGVIDGAAMYVSGVRLLLIKYTDGLRLAKFFKENYRQAKDNGILVGSWHWLRSGERSGGEGCSTGTQARFYNSILQDHPIDMRQPFVDFERLYGARDDKKNANSSDLWSFRETFRLLYGNTIGIYAGHYYWYEKGLPWDNSWTDSCLWMPRYKATETIPTRPWSLTGVPDWDFWQWSENGSGAHFGFPQEKSIDLSYWRGTLQELYAFCGKD